MQSRRMPQTSAQASASNMSPIGPSPKKRSWRRQRHADGPQQQNLPQQSTNQIDERKVQVNGFPQYTQPQDLTRLFACYGSVTVEFMTKSVAVLAYSNVKEAKAALKASRKVNIYGQFLNVIPHNGQQPTEGKPKKKQAQKREFPKSKEKSTIIPPSEIDLSGTFDEQLQKLLAAVELTKEEVTSLNTLYDDVENVLQEIWQNCTAIPFGSIASGLGIKSSDADCFVDVPHNYRNPTINHVLKANRVLLQYPNIFAEIIAIPSANTPIVKFFHIPTSFNCDLTFKTLLGVRNSKLIAALIHTDRKFVDLAILVKYWAKVHEFSGSGKLTNYTIVMMIIFYLQQVSALPAVEALQRDRADDVIVDFWNTGWAEIIPVSVDIALPDLIGGFFEYYANFDFNKNVVCPFLGCPIEKELFKNLDSLPPEFERYKENVKERRVSTMKFTTHMCVQDPFELCHNVASGIGKKRAQEIVDYFQLAAKIYKTEKMNVFNTFLKNILHENIEIRHKTISEYRFKLYPTSITEVPENDWETVVRKVTFTIFEVILKVKLSQMSSVSSPFRYKEKYTVLLKRSIWKRKQFSKFYSAMNMDFTQKEMRITEEVLRVDKNNIKVQFQLILLLGKPPKNTNILIKFVDGDYNLFREFGKFFISEIFDWYKQLLKQSKPSIDTAARIAESVRNTGDNLDSTDDGDSDECSDEQASEDSDDGASVTTTNDVNDTRKISE